MSRIIDSLLKRFDKAVEANVRSSARQFGRRSFLATTGTALARRRRRRARPALRPARQRRRAGGGHGRPLRLLAALRHRRLPLRAVGRLDQDLPAGVVARRRSRWVGTCANPDDGKNYLISYNDCCGKPAVHAAVFCNNNKGERPGYRMGLYNDINWCMANADKGYHCTVSVVMGLAE